MKRLLVLCLLGISLPWTILAQTAREDLKANPWLAGSNYVDYDRQLPDFRTLLFHPLWPTWFALAHRPR